MTIVEAEVLDDFELDVQIDDTDPPARKHAPRAQSSASCEIAPAGPRRCVTRGGPLETWRVLRVLDSESCASSHEPLRCPGFNGSTLAVVGLGQTTQGHALDGWRLCMYVDGEQHKGLWRFVVVNYRRSGGCPDVDQDRHPDLVSGDPNDVKKRTCEEVSDFVGYADDICRVLQPDLLYELSVDRGTMLPAERILLGRASEFA